MAGNFAAVQEMEAEAGALQVVRLDMQENRVVVNDDNLKIISSNLMKTNADAVSVVAIMGTYRTGKSFLLDLLMRYLRCWEHSAATEVRKTELKATAFKKAEWAAKINEGKSDEDASNEAHRAAADAVKDIADVPFPPPRNERWAVKGPSLPPPEWVTSGAHGGNGQASEGLASCPGFEWRGGMTKCTEGIWLWSRPFLLPYKGRNLAVLLMDTQGAWDGAMSKEQNATIFGLTALMASKLICNTQNMLTDDKVDAIDYFTTFAQAACAGLSSDGAPFGHLEFVVRDWAWYEKGWGFEECKQMSKQHLDNFLSSNVHGRKETSERLKEVFDSIACFGLPHPGLAVMDASFKGEFSEIGSDFFQLLDEFTRRFFQSQDFPKPSAPLGVEISPGSFENVLRNFVEAFADNRGSAVQLREAFVKVEIFKHRDLLLVAFKQRLNQLAPENKPMDPDVLDEQGQKLLEDMRKEFTAKVRTFKLEDEQQQVEEFMESVRHSLERRRKENSAEIDAAQMKLFASPAVGGGVYFLSGHPYIDAGIIGAAAFMQAKKRAAELKKDGIDLEVAHALCADVQRFTQNRVRDVHAISIAAQRWNPNTAMEQVMSRANAAGRMAAQAATAASATGASSSSAPAHKVPPPA